MSQSILFLVLVFWGLATGDRGFNPSHCAV